MSEDQGRTVRKKRIEIGTRVSGALGDFIENDAGEPGGQKKRRKRQRVVGTIIAACDHNKYRLIVDGTDRFIEAPSCQLRVESSLTTLPPYLPVVPNPRDQIEDEIEVENQDQEEHLPLAVPEAEDAELSLASDSVSDGEDGPSGTNDVEARTPYETVKQRAQDHIHSLVGKKILERKRKTREEIEWTVIPSHIPPNPIPDNRCRLGVKGLEEGDLHYNKSDPFVIGETFLHLMFIDCKKSLATMNLNIIKEGLPNVRAFSKEDILVSLALLIGKTKLCCEELCSLCIANNLLQVS